MGKKRGNSSAEAADKLAKAMEANVHAMNAMMIASVELYTSFMRTMIRAMVPAPDEAEDAAD